jgi:hypothetical protein
MDEKHVSRAVLEYSGKAETADQFKRVPPVIILVLWTAMSVDGVDPVVINLEVPVGSPTDVKKKPFEFVRDGCLPDVQYIPVV